MPNELGSNDGALSSFKGDIIADTDAPLLSTQSTGGQSYALGSSLSAGIYTMVQNGTFKATPPDPDAAISDPDNPLPYFSLESNYVSGVQITATSVEDSTVASGRKIRFTIPVGTAAGQYLRLVRYVAVPGSVARTFTYQPRSAWKTTSSTTEVVANHQSQFYQGDIATTTGTSQTRASTLTTIAASTWAYELYANPGGLPSVPADAAFVRVAVGVTVDTLTTSEWTVDLHEIRIDHGSIQSLITDQTDPARYGYASTYMNSGRLDTRSNETGVVGSSPIISIYSKQGNIGLDASQAGVNQAITGASRAASTVTITVAAKHDLEVGYWVTVAGLTGAAGTSMNGTFQVLSRTTTSPHVFTYTAAGTAGSATTPTTGATVKTAPAEGDILLTTSANGQIIAGPGGMAVTGTSSVNGALSCTGHFTTPGHVYALALFAEYHVSEATTNSNIILRASSGNTYVQDSNVANGTNPRITFMDKNGTAYATVKSGAGNVIQILNGASSTDYAQLWAERIYPMNGVTASRYMYDDGTRIAFSSGIDAAGTVICSGSMVSDAISTTTQTASAAIWVLTSGTTYSLRRNSSSARYKTNIVDADANVLECARKIKPRHYESTIEDEAGATRLGFIAEEVHDAGLTHAVGYDSDGLPETIDATALVAALYARVNDLEERLKALESR
jgi:hypothetical protein